MRTNRVTPPAVLPEVVMEARFRPPVPALDVILHRPLVSSLVQSTGIVLIHAPAGYGKSMLAAAWRADPEESRPVAWLTLDRRDVEADRLAADLAGSIAHGLGGAAVPMEVDAGMAPQDRVTALLRWCADAPPFVWILDSWGRVASGSAGEAMLRAVVDHVPATVTLVIVTREHPQIPWLAADHRVRDVSVIDLRLDHADGERLLAAAGADPAAAGRIVDAVQGWPAGVLLAGCRRWTEGQDLSNNSDIRAYVIEEVLDALDPDLARWLPPLALAGTIDIDTIRAALPLADPAVVLRRLVDAELFLEPTGVHGRFRFHTIFRRIVAQPLWRAHDEHTVALRERLAEVRAVRGVGLRGAGRLMRANGPDAFRDFVARHWLVAARSGDVVLLRSWLRNLTPGDRHAEGAILLLRGRLAQLEGDADAAEGLLDEIDRLEPDRLAAVPGGLCERQMLAFHVAVRVRGDMSTGSMAADQAMMAEASLDEEHRLQCLAVKAWVSFLSADRDGLNDRTDRAIDESIVQDLPLLTVFFLTVQALRRLEHGDIDGARQTTDDMWRIMEDRSLLELPDVALSVLTRALILTTEGDHKGAVDAVAHARRLIGRRYDLPLELFANFVKAIVAHAGGNQSAARVYVAKGRDSLLRWEDPADVGRFLDRVNIAVESPTAASVLTQAERAVLEALVTARSRRDVADRLHVSVDTVKSHLSAIYRKLDVSNADEARAWHDAQGSS